MHHDTKWYYCDRKRPLAKVCNARERDQPNKGRFEEKLETERNDTYDKQRGESHFKTYIVKQKK